MKSFVWRCDMCDSGEEIKLSPDSVNNFSAIPTGWKVWSGITVTNPKKPTDSTTSPITCERCTAALAESISNVFVLLSSRISSSSPASLRAKIRSSGNYGESCPGLPIDPLGVTNRCKLERGHSGSCQASISRNPFTLDPSETCPHCDLPAKHSGSCPHDYKGDLFDCCAGCGKAHHPKLVDERNCIRLSLVRIRDEAKRVTSSLTNLRNLAISREPIPNPGSPIPV